MGIMFLQPHLFLLRSIFPLAQYQAFNALKTNIRPLGRCFRYRAPLLQAACAMCPLAPLLGCIQRGYFNEALGAYEEVGGAIERVATGRVSAALREAGAARRVSSPRCWSSARRC